jgi:hypothetical protein
MDWQSRHKGIKKYVPGAENYIPSMAEATHSDEF